MISNKYKMLEDAVNRAETNNASDHEKQSLRGLSEIFSSQFHEHIEYIERIDDLGDRQALFLSLDTLITFSNSLGNLSRKSPFAQMRVGIRTARARTANFPARPGKAG
jgi:hypothetical protein